MDEVEIKEEWVEDVEFETIADLNVPTVATNVKCETNVEVSGCFGPTQMAVKEEPGREKSGPYRVPAAVDGVKEDWVEGVEFGTNMSCSGPTVGTSETKIEVTDYFGPTQMTIKEEPDREESGGGGLVDSCDERAGNPGIDLMIKGETEELFTDTTMPTSLMQSQPEIRTTDTREKQHGCEVCAFRCTRAAELSRHLRIHTGEKPFACEQCDYKCVRASELKRHMLNHSEERLFSCELCEYKVNVASSLKVHMKTHTGEKPFACEVCEYRCSTKGSLNVHMRTHSGERPYTCDMCGYRGITSTNLKKHKMKHSGAFHLFACSNCEFTCREPRTLKRHEKKMHSNDWPHTCEVCGHKAIRAASLRVHMVTHTGERRHACDLCGFKSFKSAALKIHKRTHTGEKPFGCALCDYKCIAKVRLKNHMRTHTGEKPHSCSVCEFMCSSRCSMRMHMMIHTGDKPYACALCDYRTVTAKQLRNHMKNHAFA